MHNRCIRAHFHFSHQYNFQFLQFPIHRFHNFQNPIIFFFNKILNNISTQCLTYLLQFAWSVFATDPGSEPSDLPRFKSTETDVCAKLLFRFAHKKCSFQLGRRRETLNWTSLFYISQGSRLLLGWSAVAS